MSEVRDAPRAREQDSRQKIVFLNSVFLLAGIVAFGMGFIRWPASALMGAIDFVFAGIAFALPGFLHRQAGGSPGTVRNDTEVLEQAESSRGGARPGRGKDRQALIIPACSASSAS